MNLSPSYHAGYWSSSCSNRSSSCGGDNSQRWSNALEQLQPAHGAVPHEEAHGDGPHALLVSTPTPTQGALSDELAEALDDDLLHWYQSHHHVQIDAPCEAHMAREASERKPQPLSALALLPTSMWRTSPNYTLDDASYDQDSSAACTAAPWPLGLQEVSNTLNVAVQEPEALVPRSRPMTVEEMRDLAYIINGTIMIPIDAHHSNVTDLMVISDIIAEMLNMFVDETTLIGAATHCPMVWLYPQEQCGWPVERLTVVATSGKNRAQRSDAKRWKGRIVVRGIGTLMICRETAAEDLLMRTLIRICASYWSSMP